MNCETCPYRLSCGNVRPACYVEKVCHPYVPYVPLYPWTTAPINPWPWVWYKTTGDPLGSKF
jgi:hypothetical protein